MILPLIANAILLALGYYWLGIGESSIPKLLWSAIFALFILSAALWVHLRPKLKNLPLLLLLALAVIGIYVLLAMWPDYSFPVASWLTLKTRKPVKPETIQSIFNTVLLIFRWVFIPWVFVPLGAAMAAEGIKGIKPSIWRREKLYWLELPLLLLLAIALPIKLITWGPPFKNFWPQFFSFSGRAIVSYLLLVISLYLVTTLTKKSELGKARD